MIFAKIDNGVCTNILQCNDDNIEGFENLIPLEEGYGIGDEYDGTWHKHVKTDEEREVEIHQRLEELDKTINRATEDLYELTDTTPYIAVQEVIDEKVSLREELQTLGGGVVEGDN